jgi:peptide/nickel transport system substrate-binding protein
VRKAISLAIDARSICANDLKGEGSPMIGHYIPERKGYQNELLLAMQHELLQKSQADKNKEARAYLIRAGFSTPKQFPVLTLAVGGPRNSVAAAWCRAVKQMLLTNLGIRLKLIYNSSVGANLNNTDIDIWRGGWVGDYPGEESYLRLFYSGAQKPLFYKNTKVDQYYLASIFADDQSPTHKLSQKICESEIMNDYALIPIYTEDFFVLNKLSVRGFELSESGIVDFSKIYLKPI